MDNTPRIKRPQRGACFRIVRGSYIDGIFLVDGNRLVRSLCRLADIEQGPSGKPRKPKQLNDVVQGLWENRRIELEKSLALAKSGEYPIGEVFAEWILLSAAVRSPRTIEIYRLMVRSYSKAVGDHGLPDFGMLHVDRFITWLNAQGATPPNNQHAPAGAQHFPQLGGRPRTADQEASHQVCAHHP